MNKTVKLGLIATTYQSFSVKFKIRIFVKLFNNFPAGDVSLDTNGTSINLTSGDYLIEYAATIGGTIDQILLALYLNDTQIDGTVINTTLESANDVRNISAKQIVSLTANGLLQLKNAGTSEPTLSNIKIFITKLN